MRSTHRRLASSFAALALVAAIASLTQLRRPRAHGSVWHWAPGTEFDYRLTWRAHNEVHLGNDAQSQLAGGADLDLDLTLRSHGRVDERWLLEYEVGAVRRHAIEMLGKSLIADDAEATRTFVGQRAYVLVADDGSVERVYFAGGAPPLFKELMQSLLPLVHPIAPDDAGDRWSARERGPSGVAESDYRRDGNQLTRARRRYLTLTALPQPAADAKSQLVAGARITLGGDGALAELADDERLTVATPARTLLSSESTLRLIVRERRRAMPVRAVALGTLESRRPGEHVPSANVERQLLEQQAAGLDAATVIAGLGRYAATDGDASRRWFARAAAAVELDPALCARLAEEFAAHKGVRATRGFIFDLLAAAGGPSAQAAMRTAWAGVSRDDADRFSLVQRFARLARPDGETTRVVAGVYRDAAAGKDVHFAAAYTLGAMASTLARTGDASGARALADGLAADLEAARATADKRELLSSLGNAGLATSAPAIARFVAADEPELRARAAWALRKIDGADTDRTLATLAADPDDAVAAEAVRALATRTLDDTALRALATSAGAAAAPSTDVMLVGLLGHHLDGGEPVRALLQAIANRTRDRETADRARSLLSQVNG